MTAFTEIYLYTLEVSTQSDSSNHMVIPVMQVYTLRPFDHCFGFSSLLYLLLYCNIELLKHFLNVCLIIYWSESMNFPMVHLAACHVVCTVFNFLIYIDSIYDSIYHIS